MWSLMIGKIRSVTVALTILFVIFGICTVFDKTRHLLLPVEHTVQKFRVSKKS